MDSIEKRGASYEQEAILGTQLRKDTDDFIKRIKELPSGQERTLAITKLQECVAWVMGRDSKILGEQNPTPVNLKNQPSNADSTGTTIETPAAGVKPLNKDVSTGKIKDISTGTIKEVSPGEQTPPTAERFTP